MIIFATNKLIRENVEFYHSPTGTTTVMEIVGLGWFNWFTAFLNAANSFGGLTFAPIFSLPNRQRLSWTINLFSGAGYVLAQSSNLGALLGRSSNLISLDSTPVSNEKTPAHLWALGTTRIVLEYNKFVASTTVSEGGQVVTRRSAGVEQSNLFNRSMLRVADFSHILLKGEEFLTQYNTSDPWRAFEGVWSEWENGLQYYTDLFVTDYRLVWPTSKSDDFLSLIDIEHTRTPLTVTIRFQGILEEI